MESGGGYLGGGGGNDATFHRKGGKNTTTLPRKPVEAKSSFQSPLKQNRHHHEGGTKTNSSHGTDSMQSSTTQKSTVGESRLDKNGSSDAGMPSKGTSGKGGGEEASLHQATIFRMKSTPYICLARHHLLYMCSCTHAVDVLQKPALVQQHHEKQRRTSSYNGHKQRRLSFDNVKSKSKCDTVFFIGIFFDSFHPSFPNNNS